MSGQTVYANQSAAFPGMRANSDCAAKSMVNDTGAGREIDTLTVNTAADSTAYSATMGGVTFSYTSGTGATATTIRDGLIAAYRAIQQFEGVAWANPSSTNAIRFTAAVAGTAFVLATSDSNMTAATSTANTSQVQIPFGRAIVHRDGAVQQVDTLTITATNSTAYAFAVAGTTRSGVAVGATTVGYTSDSSATTAEIQAGLLAALALLTAPEGPLEDICYGEASSTNKVVIKAKYAGVGLTVTESDSNLALAHTTANTAPGASGTTDKSAALPSASGQRFQGVLERIHSNVDPTNANVAFPQGAASFGQDLSVIYRGKVWVETDVAVKKGDAAYYRFAGTAADIGKWRNDADSNQAQLVANAEFESSVTSAGLVELLLR